MRKSVFLSLIALISFVPAFAENGIFPPEFATTRLGNGLSVAFLPDSDTPYATLTLFFRGGAFAQGEKTAGVFRPVLVAMARKLAAEGFTHVSTEVAQERIALTVACDAPKVGAAMEALARSAFDFSPSVTTEDAAAAKGFVEEALANPVIAFYRSMENRLFHKYPWRKDYLGRPDLIPAFTDADFGAVRAFFVPGNALLSVSGPLTQAQVFDIATTVCSAYPMGADPLPVKPPPFPKPTISRFQFLMYPDASVPRGVGKIEIFYRGPGLREDAKAAQAAFIWKELPDIPSVAFRQNLMRDVPKLLSASSIRFDVAPRMDASLVTLSADFLVDKDENAADRAQRWFKEQVKGVQFTEFHRGKSPVPEAALPLAIDRFAGSLALLASSPRQFFAWFADIWAGLDLEPAVAFVEGTADVKMADVRRFVKDYVISALEIVAVRLSPEDFEREKAPAQARRFEFIDVQNSVWWKK